MDEENIRALLISANVGSIFEDPDHMFKPWMEEFTKCITKLEPGLIAIHCQEVGGKNYEASMQHVNQFIKIILGCEEMQKYDRARVFLDEDYTAADKFTALGNLYFIHECIEEVSIWDFVDCKFVPVEGREVLSGNIENIPIKEKAKFPQHFFPEFKWSRKGFIRTRWSINNCVFDLINIHLFHDASNIVAMQSSPSLYSENRQQALLHTLQRFENDNYETVPFFMFGDFNFRLDSHLLVKAITEKTDSSETRGKKDQITKVVYKEQENGKVVLTVETKGFDYHDKHSDLFYNTSKWLHQYDKELIPLKEKLKEFEFSFPPSYPFSENINDGKSYMKTRCPSWCDRILFSNSAKNLILTEDLEKPCYDILGKDICMGDHKPVYLHIRLKPGQGNLNESFTSSSYKWKRRNTISINGEEMETSDIDSINIHDYAVFEKHKHLPLSFRASIKSRNSDDFELHEIIEDTNHLVAPQSVARKRSFQDAAREIVQMERVLLMWPRGRDRHHSSSSEDYNSDSDVANNNKLSPSSSRNNHILDEDSRSVETALSQISLEDSHELVTNGHDNLPNSHIETNTKVNCENTKDVFKSPNTINCVESSPSVDSNCKLIKFSANKMHEEAQHVETTSPSHGAASQHLVASERSSSIIKMARSQSRCCYCVVM